MYESSSAKLSIVIPTFNRADFLDYSLSVHVPLAAKYAVQIFVFDNASSDSTSTIVEKWQEKYPLVRYFRHSENIGAEGNFQTALSQPDTEYIWLLGDTYEITENLFSHVLVQLNEGYDHVLVNVGGEVKGLEGKVYIDRDELLVDLFWLSTCLSCHVFSRQLVEVAEFKRYQNTYFVHVGIFFDYIAARDFRVLWVSEYSVERIFRVGAAQKDTWMSKFFEVWIAARSNLIMSLPARYSLSAKLLAIRAIESNDAHFSVKRALVLRAAGVLNIRSFFEYSVSLKLVCSGLVYCACFFIAFLPVFLVRVAKRFYQAVATVFRGA